jgi:integrase
MSNKPNMRQWTLSKFANWWIQSQPVDSPFAPRNVRYIRSVVAKFERFKGGEVRCMEVNQAMIDQFYRWSIELGHHKNTVAADVGFIKGLVRRWDPKRFPREDGNYKALTFVNADIEGTLEQLFQQHYLPERPQIGCARTVDLYGKCFHVFGLFLGHPATLADCTDVVLGRYLRWLVEVRGVKPQTANMYGKRIKAIWNWAARKHLVNQFPTIGNLPVAERDPVSWTEEELRALLKACGKQSGKIGSLRASDFWTAFHLVLWDGGERTGAMLAIQWSWIDFKRGYLTVPAEFRKGRIKPATYHLKPPTIAALKRIRGPEREAVFEWPFCVGTFQNKYRKLIESAGLRYVKRQTTPQQMRRTFASHLEAAGGNATKALKHSDRRCTEKSYLDPKIVDKMPDNERLFPLGDDAA